MVNRWFSIVLLWFCVIIPHIVGTFHWGRTEPISRHSGNVLKNLFSEQVYRDRVVTSWLDDSWIMVKFYRLLKDSFRAYTGDTGLKRSGWFLQKPLPRNTPFPCRKANQRSRVVPESVHELRPGDIDVIAAMGDSVTAGTGANAETIPESITENRGLSFSIGGQGNWRTHLTLPNILKEFNPRLVGYAYGSAFSKERSAQFNMGENIATVSDMPFEAYQLLRRMRLDRRVKFNMKKHWKVVTIMIGANNFCSDICLQKDAPIWMLEDIERNIIKTLRILRENMPRTFVNLVTEPLVNLVLSMNRGFSRTDNSLGCIYGRTVFCNCLEGKLFSQNRLLYILLERKYRKIFERVAHREEFQRMDFAVVHQPFGVNATVFIDNQVPDDTIMAYDCLHWSQKGHAVAANGLWNNMLQPVGKKQVGFRPLYEEFECPTDDDPYIKTYLNS